MALFVGDVVRILRDLYGEFDEYAVKKIRRAVLHLMQRYTSESLRDLWREHENAETVDYGWYSIGVVPGDGDQFELSCKGNSAAQNSSSGSRYSPRSFWIANTQCVAEMFDERWRSGSP